MQIKEVEVTALIPYAKNSRTHDDAQVAQIAASIKEFGWTNPILVDGDKGVIAGHGRLLAARKLGMDKVPTIELKNMTEAQKKAYIIADNKLAMNAGWDFDFLALEIQSLQDENFDINLLGFDDKELNDLLKQEISDPTDGSSGNGSLAKRFLIPPFSVFNAREGWWQDRKRAWLALGIKSEEGRDIGSTNVGKNVPDYMAGRGNNEGGSIFDPVMCEIVYTWFCPPKGLVLDPFAGGSVRGVVASKLGRQYIGYELRQEQVDANIKQGTDLCFDDPLPPAWICGDSQNIDKTCTDVKADLIFSCPPYADLEIYSDNPKDLSTFTYPEFKAAYFEIIKKSCNLLKDNAFACFVVGDVRDKKGNYYNFVGDTVEAFKTAGLNYYNEAILITAVGSLPIRAGKMFSASRKLGKTHQNVLVFVKGDGKKAASNCGIVEIAEKMLIGED
jgi:hypothetical protein